MHGLGHTLSKEQVLPLTFEPEEKDRKNPQENIQNLKRSFLEGLQNRVESWVLKAPYFLSGVWTQEHWQD